MLESTFLQPPENYKKIDAISTETADGLGVDEFDFPGLTICHQALEAWSGIDTPTRTDVGVGIDKFPQRMIQNVLSLEIHLGRQAVQLPFHLGADTAVKGDPRQSKTRRHGSRDGSYRGFGFLIIGHDWSCIPRIVGDGQVSLRIVGFFRRW
jgi:hypothetical protein